MPSPSTRRRLGVAATAALALLAPVAVALPAHASSTTNEIVYTADADNDGVYSIVLRDLLTRRATTVVPPDPARGWLYDDPELSPDGQRIAFSTDRGAAQYDEGIAVVARDGSGFRRLTTPTVPGPIYTIDVAPAWSPDGRTLLFTRITTDTTNPAAITTTNALYTVPAAGGAATAVPNGTDGYLGDWSPDGRSIVFAALAGDADSGPITVMGVDGSGRRALTGAVGQMPAWSPDGSTIAFATITARDPDPTREEDVTQIATVPAGGGTVRVLGPTRPSSTARTVAQYPSWSPDGESLLYDVFGYSATDSFPPGELWTVDAAGTRAGTLFTSPGDEAQVHAQGPVPSRVTPGAASTYTPVTPRRILDTRNGTGVRSGPVGPTGTVDLAVRGVTTAQGPVPANASAVVLNLTVTGPTGATDVRAYPSGTPVPGASNLNAGAGQTAPNLVTVRIGDNGAVTLRNTAGSAHLIADIAGWYTPDAAGVGFRALDPSRILDTRAGVGSPARPVGPAGAVDLTVTGDLRTIDDRTVTVPADARAVVLNVTATGATEATDVRVYPVPADGSVPTVSNLNLLAGQTTPNLVTVAVGRDGQVRLRNLNGEVDLIADLAGYYAAGAPGRFVPVAPTRFLDTRSGTGTAAIPITPQGHVDLRVAGTRGVPPTATAAVLNLTGTGVSATTDVRAFPAGAGAVPTVSNLNLTRGATRANLAIVRTGTDGRVRIRNTAGQLNVIGDLAGYMVG